LIFARTTNAIIAGTDEWLLDVSDVMVMPTLIFEVGDPTLTSSGGMIAVEKIVAARTDARTPHEGGESEIDETYGAAAKKDVNSTIVTQTISICRSSSGRK
jgi:hypothetical protein